ncbi:MAG TPA: DNA alkylation repair protein [Desulfotomaculum sp.]|nr:MAG: DNA alkylation repair enzyme [Desulfotomaculum sp. 46_296]HAG11166.1 DNA alkylation repair protein [Desulfotomaculum sp.]HBY03128.1 DNA alkylation repair protein [Desulfotomaculum sp.]
MNNIIQRIRADLENSADDSIKKSFQRFFKEEVKCYGVKTGLVGKIANKYWKEVKTLEKKDIFKFCEELYMSDFTEEAFIVSSWRPKLADKFEPGDLKTFESWIEKFINNWAKCDGFCNHSVGSFIEKFPESLKEVKNWTKSKNGWLKRAAAVSLIIPAKKGEYLADIFEIADDLLQDDDDLVQKGYGWLLKEASRLNQREVFNYVVRNKRIMPRTALRYAIELMPKELRAEAMKRD